MRIGIDAHIVGAGKGGVERFLFELCLRLPRLAPQHRFVLLMNDAARRAAVVPAAPNVEQISLPFSNPLIERALVMPWLARKHALDVLLVQRLAPWALGRCRIALTVHDITPLKFPAHYRGLTNMLVRALTPGSVRRSARVLVPTATIAREVAERFDAPLDKFHPYFNGVDRDVFHPASDPTSWPATARKFGIEDSYLFASGAMERRKNFTTVIEAMRRLPASDVPLLVLAGGTRDARYGEEVRALVAAHGLGQRVRHLGFVSDSELIDLYRHATAFVSASLDEGFDMPVLEAMACATPTLCSDIGVHRELFDPGAAFFAPERPDELADAVLALKHDRPWRERCVAQGLEIARRFDWQRAAQQVAEALAHPSLAAARSSQ